MIKGIVPGGCWASSSLRSVASSGLVWRTGLHLWSGEEPWPQQEVQVLEPNMLRAAPQSDGDLHGGAATTTGWRRINPKHFLLAEGSSLLTSDPV